MMERMQTSFTCIDKSNVIFRIEQKLHMLNTTIPSKCQKCKTSEGNLLHMLLNCPVLEDFGEYIIYISSKIIVISISYDPRVWI